MLIKKQMNEYWKAGRNKLTLSMVLKLLQRCRCGTDGKIFSRILLILALLAFLPGAGYSNETPTGIDTLRRIVIQEGGDAAWEYLDSLPAQSRQEVAQLAAADPDNALNTIGITVLVQSGHLDEAVPALSAKVADGDDLSRFGYSWLHSDEPDLVLRMYLKICRDLLVRLDSFTPEQRVHVERFLRSGGSHDRLAHFSREAVEQRLEKIAAEQRKEKGRSNAEEN